MRRVRARRSSQSSLRTPIIFARDRLHDAARIFHSDGSKYNDDNVVFRPARMSPERMLEDYLHRWREFYCVRPALDGDDYAG